MPSTPVASAGVYCSHKARYVSRMMPVATAQAHHLADGHLFVIARQENGDGLIFASSRGIAIRVDSYDEDKIDTIQAL